MSVKLLHKRSNIRGSIPAVEDLEIGELALNTIDGKLFFKKFDNIQESIVIIDPNLIVKEVDDNNNLIDSKLFNNVRSISFNSDSGILVENLENGEVKVGLSGYFKSFDVPGQTTLTPNGVENITIKAGNGIILTTNSSDNPSQSLTIATTLKSVQLFQDGILKDTTGTVRWYAPNEITISKIIARISNLSNQNIQINVLKSSNLQESIILNADTEKLEYTTNFKMGVDDYMTVDLLTNGNTTGTGLSVEFFYSFD